MDVRTESDCVYFGTLIMTGKFAYLVERLYRAGKRMDTCHNKEERMQAQRWLILWNRAAQCEHKRNERRNSS